MCPNAGSDTLPAIGDDGPVDSGSPHSSARLTSGCDGLWPALWTYLDVPGVEPTNNVAERAIRPAVLWRKGSLGTQSGSGARFAGATLTLGATCRLHGRYLIAYLSGVCTASMAGLAVPQLLPAPA